MFRIFRRGSANETRLNTECFAVSTKTGRLAAIDIAATEMALVDEVIDGQSLRSFDTKAGAADFFNTGEQFIKTLILPSAAEAVKGTSGQPFMVLLFTALKK
jgi:hypothetical protein